MTSIVVSLACNTSETNTTKPQPNNIQATSKPMINYEEHALFISSICIQTYQPDFTSKIYSNQWHNERVRGQWEREKVWDSENERNKEWETKRNVSTWEKSTDIKIVKQNMKKMKRELKFHYNNLNLRTLFWLMLRVRVCSRSWRTKDVTKENNSEDYILSTGFISFCMPLIM